MAPEVKQINGVPSDGTKHIREVHPMQEELISIPEFARRLGGIKPGTVHNWLSQSRFGLRRVKVGSRTMLRAADISKVISDDKHHDERSR